MKRFRLLQFLWFLFFMLFISTSLLAQTTKVSVKLRNGTIKELFSQIEKQTDYKFSYREEVVKKTKKPITIDKKSSSIESVLADVLTGTNLEYLIASSESIIISDKGAVTANTSSKQVGFKGKLVDQNGTPIIGATVIVKGTTLGAVTDASGGFAFKAKEGNTVVCSCIGYEDVEYTVTATKSDHIITMKESAIAVDEVVVVGYGTMRKKDLTGSLASVNGDRIIERQNAQVSQSLQGAISGVMVTRSGSSPGATASINIRGITSIGDSSPLVIVDGIAVDDVNQVSPSDIESLTVLKDAASSSIYGSRAAAGVILITTKRAKANTSRLTYNYEFGIETPVAQPGFQNATEYMTTLNELRWNDLGNGDDEYPTYSKDLIDNYAKNSAENPDQYPDTNWKELFYDDVSIKETHSVSIASGTEKFKSNSSIRYNSMDALVPNQGYDRITARSNNDFTINDFVSGSFDVNFKRTASKSGYSSQLYSLNLAPAVYPAYWENGEFATGKNGNNPIAAANQGGFNNAWYTQLGGKAALDITPVKGLKLSAVLAPTFNFTKSKAFKKHLEIFDAEDPTVKLNDVEGHSSTYLGESRSDNYQITTQFFANYNKSFGSSNLSAMVGFENYYAFYESLGASRDQYLLTNYPYLNLGPDTYRDNSGSAYETAYRSVFGRVVYSYDNKYMIQANLRYDGSSRFHKDYRWGMFPSVSAGWVVSEENFMNDQNIFSYLKLRASWGSLGNERIGNYPYQATMSFGNTLFYQNGEVVSAQNAAQIKYAIRDISWETTTSLDVGIDANFFNNRLSLVADYYVKNTKDMLLALEIPTYVGFENPNQNTGRMETKGFDVELRWSDKVGDFSYSIAGNISQFKSVMGDLGGTEFLGDQIKVEGSEFNEWYGYIADGLFQTEEEIKNSPLLISSTKPGDVKYKDISGPDGVPDGIISADYDKTLLGGSLPQFMYGVNAQLAYKNFDFSFTLQGVGKQTTHMISHLKSNTNNWGAFSTEYVGNQWSMYNTEEQNLDAKYPRLTQTNKSSNNAVSTYWLFNGGYMRLKNMTLGYTIPSNITNKFLSNGFRVYVSANDLFSLDRYPKGYDPEQSAYGYPITSSFIVGASITF